LGKCVDIMSGSWDSTAVGQVAHEIDDADGVDAGEGDVVGDFEEADDKDHVKK